jgi:hypothetical protein
MDWVPTLNDRNGPVYQRIVEALTADIASGRLRRGQQLPTHRALANVHTPKRGGAGLRRRASGKARSSPKACPKLDTAHPDRNSTFR